MKVRHKEQEEFIPDRRQIDAIRTGVFRVHTSHPDLRFTVLGGERDGGGPPNPQPISVASDKNYVLQWLSSDGENGARFGLNWAQPRGWISSPLACRGLGAQRWCALAV